MKGPGHDPFSSRLLSAGKKDRPTNDQVSRAVALALASSAVVAATPPAPVTGTSSALKLGLAAVGLTALGVVGYVVSSPRRAPEPPVTMTSAAAPPPVAVAVAVATPAPPPSDHAISVADLPAAPPVETVRSAVVPTTWPAPPREASLADELAKLQAARRALRGGDATGALAELAAYRQSFPNGALRAEEAALRIDAELASGDAARAKADAARFLRDFPSSQEAARIRALEERLESP